MSQLIYKGQIRTKVGPSEVRITDTVPDGSTPDLLERSPLGGITLEMGDTGRGTNEAPTSIGSFFDLSFRDRPSRAFQKAFRRDFRLDRYAVELDVPRVGTWHGYVKTTRQSRSLGEKTDPEIVSVTCFDGLAALSDFSPLNARRLSVADWLADTFGLIDGSLPVYLYSDLTATTHEGTTKDMRSIRASEQDGKSIVPPNINSDEQLTSEDAGLSGGDRRSQLDTLCKSLSAIAYQDIALGGWAFIDRAAVGADVSGLIYQAGSWSEGTIPGRTIDADDNEVISESSDRLRTLASAKEVCLPFENWTVDPGFEASETGTDTVFWDTKDWDRLARGKMEYQDALSENFVQQTISFSDYQVTEDADVLLLEIELESPGDIIAIFAELNPNEPIKGDSAQTQFSYRLYVPITEHKSQSAGTKDPLNTADSLEQATVGCRIVSDTPIVEKMEVGFLKRLTDNAHDLSGRNNDYQRIDTICFQDQGRGTQSLNIGTAGFTVDVGGTHYPAESWDSKRYSTGPYTRHKRWLALNELSLRPPSTERLEARLDGRYAPLGTRIRWTKPGDERASTFSVLKGRRLHLQSEMDAATEVKDVEIPDAVVDLIG